MPCPGTLAIFARIVPPSVPLLGPLAVPWTRRPHSLRAWPTSSALCLQLPPLPPRRLLPLLRSPRRLPLLLPPPRHLRPPRLTLRLPGLPALVTQSLWPALACSRPLWPMRRPAALATRLARHPASLPEAPPVLPPVGPTLRLRTSPLPLRTVLGTYPLRRSSRSRSSLSLTRSLAHSPTSLPR